MKDQLREPGGDILFLCQYFYPEYITAATLAFETAAYLAGLGYRVDALCGYPKEYCRGEEVPPTETAQGVRIRRINYIQPRRVKTLGRIVNYLSFSLALMFRLFSMRGYEYIVVYSTPPVLPYIAYLAGRLFQTKVIFISYDVYPEIAIATGAASPEGIMARLMRRINDRVFANAYKVVALSEEMKSFLIRFRPIEAEKVEVIPNWSCGETPPARRANGDLAAFCGGAFVVSYMGNMGICQEMDLIMNAIRLLRDEPGVKFILAGHGSKMPGVKAALADENLANARVFDYLHAGEYLDALERSGCFVVSLEKSVFSLCCPSKTYSYIAAGRPLLMVMEQNSDVVQEVEAYGAGYHVESAEQMAEYILRLKNDRGLHRQMMANCQRLYHERHRKEYSMRKYSELFTA